MLLDRLKQIRERRRNLSIKGSAAASNVAIRAILFDWGNTLMREFPSYTGPMAHWPRVRSMPGVHSALERLPRRLVCCVATGAADSDSQLVAEALARVRIRHYFRHLFTWHEVGAAKPDPAFYQGICQRIDLTPRHVVMVGDNFDNDIAPAKAVGMRTVWITREKIDRLPPEADAIIASMRQLSRTIERMSR